MFVWEQAIGKTTQAEVGIDEQQIIGDDYRNLDHFIPLHQRKLAEMKKLKKVLIQLLPMGKVRINV